MIKREELTNPASCMSRAKDDEMTFVLLGRDKAAPVAIRAWVAERLRLGKNTQHDAQITEALVCAGVMEGHVPTPDPSTPAVRLALTLEQVQLPIDLINEAVDFVSMAAKSHPSVVTRKKALTILGAIADAVASQATQALAQPRPCPVTPDGLRNIADALEEANWPEYAHDLEETANWLEQEPRPVVLMPWQPIATAPKFKDGFIDLWLSSSDGVDQWRETGCWWNDHRKLWANHRGMWDCATHWMPIPDPPKVAE